MELLELLGPKGPSYIFCVIVTAILSYYLTNAVKKPIIKIATNADAEAAKKEGRKPRDPAWWTLIFNLLPVIIGTVAGGLFLNWTEGSISGMIGGVFSTQIYRKFENKIEQTQLTPDMVKALADLTEKEAQAQLEASVSESDKSTPDESGA